jgi:acetylglutamate kinase
MLVVKIGGSLDGTEALVQDLAHHDGELIVVHGGGPRVGAELAARGFETRFEDGLRVTPPEQMTVVEQVLTQLGKELADRLSRLGRLAVGLSGRDARLLRAEPVDGALGRVGRITAVNTSLLFTLMSRHLTPVVSPIASSADGPLNVNADEVAAAVAGCLGEPLVYLTDVPGVLADPADPESRIPVLDGREARERIAAGTIAGGMIPKVQSALAALEFGAPWVMIAPGEAGALPRLLSGGVGTRIVPEKISREV